MNQVDKIVLSSCRTKCTVYLVNGPTLFFNFAQLGMSCQLGLLWIESVFSGPNWQEVKRAA